MYYERLKSLRKSAKLSQKEIADLLQMHTTTYVRYETGEREIPLNIAILIARFHKVSLDYLAGLTNNPRK